MIVITNPDPLLNETSIINRLFEEGLELLHIRKPELPIDDLMVYISGINQAYHNKLVLHQHYSLAHQFDSNRLHFPEKSRADFETIANKLSANTQWIFSTSTHSIDIFNALQDVFEYAFLSPVYNSISKPGYMAEKVSIESIQERTNFKAKLVALGGINNYNYSTLLQHGFDDVALLGAIWMSSDPVEEFKRYNNEK